MTERVCVVVPTRNEAAWLPDCLESLRAQMGDAVPNSLWSKAGALTGRETSRGPPAWTCSTDSARELRTYATRVPRQWPASGWHSSMPTPPWADHRIDALLQFCEGEAGGRQFAVSSRRRASVEGHAGGAQSSLPSPQPADPSGFQPAPPASGLRRRQRLSRSPQRGHQFRRRLDQALDTASHHEVLVETSGDASGKREWAVPCGTTSSSTGDGGAPTPESRIRRESRENESGCWK